MVQPARRALAGRPTETHRLRAALLGVYASAHTGAGFSDNASTRMRPMAIPDAVRTINRAQGDVAHRTRAAAAGRLAVSVKNHGRADLHPYLVDLVGRDTANEILEVPPKSAPSIIMEKAFDVILPHAPQQAAEVAPSPPVETESQFEPRTMATTVTVTGTGSGDFETLAMWMDPQSWTTSSFWVASEKVLLGSDGRFVKDPNPPRLGTSWGGPGYLYEYVEWNWNESVVSAFQNYLNITFEVNHHARTIELKFSLYACQGSLMLSRVSPDGIDLDSGYSRARPRFSGPHDSPAAITMNIDAQKRLRFSDILSRTTSDQGQSGAGQSINLNTPVVASMWMDDLVYNLISKWKQGLKPSRA